MGDTKVDTNDRAGGTIGSWKMRRRFMWVITIFCMYCICYIMHFGADTRVNEAIIEMAFACIILTQGSYVFGAAWQDINFKKLGCSDKGEG